jgi:hypothetical protein
MTAATPPPEPPTTDRDDVADLADQLRELAGHDPADARRVVAEVLAALDRASGGALAGQLPEGLALDHPSEAAPRPTLDS